ncbi:MAG: hypothetical protein QM758_06385 [Armatimonas sp.]
MSDYEAISMSMAECLKKRRDDAQRIRAICQLNASESLSPKMLERYFPVACVSVPNLCIGAACRWALQGAGHLPPGLQLLLDTDSLEAGRPLRGACLAFRGKALLLADERDEVMEQHFSFVHEAAHFLLHHLLPRQDCIRRLGPNIIAVLDGERPANLGERFDAALRRADFQFHTHLYRRDAPRRESAEVEADALACLLLAPHSIASENSYPLPLSVAEIYAEAQRLLQNAPQIRHPLLHRMRL